MKLCRRINERYTKVYGYVCLACMGMVFGFLVPGMAVAAALPAAAQPRPAITPEPLSTGSIFQMFAGLVLVVGLVFLLAWAMRRFGSLHLSGGDSLRVLGALSMGARERVVLIQAGETQLLLGVAPGRVQTLHVLDKPISAAKRQSAQTGFGERLRQVMSRGAAS